MKMLNKEYLGKGTAALCPMDQRTGPLDTKSPSNGTQWLTTLDGLGG